MFSSVKRTAYDRHKERAARRQARQSAAGRSIPPIPPPVHPDRYEQCRRHFRAYCETYLRTTFPLAWSPDHLTAIDMIQSAVLSGDLFALAMPRGSGKTSLCEAAALWAASYGHHPFICLIGASETKAVANMATIQTELETNDLIDEDFPAITRPIKALEGIANRARGQMHNGKRTALLWNAKRLILPTIDESPASGAIIMVAGITSSQIRGPKFKRRDGSTVRPTLVIIDDPQTDQSAKNDAQNRKREDLLAGAILGMAGPGKKIAGLMPCTVIRPNDMADRILDRTKHPEWRGQRTKLLYEFPSNTQLWDAYWTVLRDSGQGAANEFYEARREDMDAGAKPAWEARKTDDELSALQHAMGLYYRDPQVFFAEYQNDPKPEQLGDVIELTPDRIAARCNMLAPWTAPIQSELATAFIDIQQNLLFWCVTAWSPGFAGAVVNYGTWPDQRRRYFTRADATETYATHCQTTSFEGRLIEALQTCVNMLSTQQILREDNAPIPLKTIMIDANWGTSTDTVYSFCRQRPLVVPSHGKFVGASSLPMDQYKKRPGDRTGHHWRMPALASSRQVRHIVYDTNYWKSFIAARLTEPIGGKTSMTLFGDRPDFHRRFSEHLCAEYRIKTEGRGRTVEEWKLRPERPDNDWLDCLVGTAIGAAFNAVSTEETKPAAVKTAVSFADLQRKARATKWQQQARRPYR